MLKYFLISLGIWNVVTFAVAAADKHAAKAASRRVPERRVPERRVPERRVPERRFIFFAATLGGAGVLCAFYLLRHKTRHRTLLFAVWTLTALSYSAALYAAAKLALLLH